MFLQTYYEYILRPKCVKNITLLTHVTVNLSYLPSGNKWRKLANKRSTTPLETNTLECSHYHTYSDYSMNAMKTNTNTHTHTHTHTHTYKVIFSYNSNWLSKRLCFTWRDLLSSLRNYISSALLLSHSILPELRIQVFGVFVKVEV